jgi:hypothetical protein
MLKRVQHDDKGLFLVVIPNLVRDLDFDIVLKFGFRNYALTIFLFHCFIFFVTFRVSMIRGACLTTQA